MKNRPAEAITKPGAKLNEIGFYFQSYLCIFDLCRNDLIGCLKAAFCF